MEPDTPYSNREVREKWANMSEDIKSILEQTKKTNGRVSELELARAQQAGFYKAVAIFGAVGWGVLSSLVVWMLLQIVDIDNKINQGVAQALEAYEVTVTK